MRQTALIGGIYRLIDLADESGIIWNLAAHEVTFTGPAVMLVDGGLTWDSPSAVGTPVSLLWEIGDARDEITGAVKFVNSTLTKCAFEKIGFAARGDSLDKMLAAMKIA